MKKVVLSLLTAAMFAVGLVSVGSESSTVAQVTDQDAQGIVKVAYDDGPNPLGIVKVAYDDGPNPLGIVKVAYDDGPDPLRVVKVAIDDHPDPYVIQKPLV
jgi:hypothetical protein